MDMHQRPRVVMAKSPMEGGKKLPSSFTPGEWDVICHKGRDCYNHVGNIRFREMINNSLDQYANGARKAEKSKVVKSIIDTIQRNSISTGGGFIRQEEISGQWYRISDKVAREKTGQALRDGIRTREVAREKAAHQHQKPKNPSDVSSSDVATLARGANPLVAEATYPPGSSSTFVQGSMPLIPNKRGGTLEFSTGNIDGASSSHQAKRARILEGGRQDSQDAITNSGSSSSDIETVDDAGKSLASGAFSPSISSSMFDSPPEDHDYAVQLPRASLDNDPVVLPQSAEPNIFPPYRSNLPLSFNEAVGSVNTNQGINLGIREKFGGTTGNSTNLMGSTSNAQQSKSSTTEPTVNDGLWGRSLNQLVHGSHLTYQHGGSARINVSAADRISALPERVLERGFRQPHFFGQEETKTSSRSYHGDDQLGDFFDPRNHPQPASDKKKSPQLKGDPGSRKR